MHVFFLFVAGEGDFEEVVEGRGVLRVEVEVFAKVGDTLGGFFGGGEHVI